MSSEVPDDGSVLVVLSAPGLDPPAGLDRLDGRLAIRHTHAQGLADALPGAHALLMWDHFSAALGSAWDRADRLGWIHVAAAGVDHVMTPELRASGVVVTNSRGVFDGPIAEYVLALLLARAKDLATTVRDTDAHRWHYRENARLAGTRAVVVGTGALGRATGRLLRAVGVVVRGVARSSREADPDFDEVVGAAELAKDPDAVVGDADHVVVTAPLTPATRGMVSAEVLAAMSPRAHLVNVGRGPIVDTAALVDALQAGRLGAASLDVTDVEPLPPDDPLFAAPNVLISPHCSGDVIGWRDTLAALFVDQMERFLDGRPLANVVDLDGGFVPGVGS
ncbi:D-2-hydroxyacid dehydrogenase [Actinomycetospora endophytica]|uniref:D-2-hydroxyacid dehydrogenase n=1 Tax=Actinomycetospora endophytica TaxID=2291215 RepID=A0ABS8PGA8_9PSEU|nr:D-2-hydroxyacid dehydrogenase [Actinomycetospora endophytica]MCD2197294.1 D-2-hydroxyacid dehydrogenase [Actinomycetospora endophytica]